MNDIIIEIEGKKYVVFKLSCPARAGVRTRMINETEAFGGIVQSCEVKTGFFDNTVDLTVLIPEENAIDFSNARPND